MGQGAGYHLGMADTLLRVDAAILAEGAWELAVIGPHEGRAASVKWGAGKCLPAELIPIAVELGFPNEKLVNSSVGELTMDLSTGEVVFLRGTLML